MQFKLLEGRSYSLLAVCMKQSSTGLTQQKHRQRTHNSNVHRIAKQLVLHLVIQAVWPRKHRHGTVTKSVRTTAALY